MPHFFKTMKKSDNRHLWDKILFGTDWYMTLVVSPSGQKAYKDFCAKMKARLDKIDNSLWVRFTYLNPIKFYGLDAPNKLTKLKDGLENVKADNVLLKKHFALLKKSIQRVENVKQST